MKKKLKLTIFLVLFILICIMITIIFILNKKTKEPMLYELTYTDFEQGLAYDYQLLDCKITSDSIEFYISGVQDSYYTAMCKNLENLMIFYSKNRTNVNQKDFIFYLYENEYYKNIEPKATVLYHLYEDFCEVVTLQKIPEIGNTDGLLPYEFKDFDGKILTIKWNLSHYSLQEKIKQMKVLYNVVMENNHLDDLILNIEDKDTVYVYDNTSTIKIIETREINY